MAAWDAKAAYDRVARAWDATRAGQFPEKAWITRILAALPARAAILDVGCGAGRPIAAAFLAAGHRVTGLDLSPQMLTLARQTLPQGDWIEGDMRALALKRTFDAVIAWDSFFHLSAEDQRQTLPRLAAHLRPNGWLLFTTGPKASEVWGAVAGEPVWHASLDPAEYAALLTAQGLTCTAFRPEDPETAGHSVWLAQRTPDSIPRQSPLTATPFR